MQKPPLLPNSYAYRWRSNKVIDVDKTSPARRSHKGNLIQRNSFSRAAPLSLRFRCQGKMFLPFIGSCEHHLMGEERRGDDCACGNNTCSRESQMRWNKIRRKKPRPSFSICMQISNICRGNSLQKETPQPTPLRPQQIDFPATLSVLTTFKMAAEPGKICLETSMVR